MESNLKYDSRLYAFEKEYTAGRRRRLEGKLHSRNACIFVAEKNKKFCGYLLVEKVAHPHFLAKNEAYVKDLFVVRGMRRKGAAKLLLAQAEAWAKGKGMDFLGIETDAKNSPAQSAYEKAGYSLRRLRLIKWLK
jgi:ribosomal protein S18 acetylase RimI-like enzyme